MILVWLILIPFIGGLLCWQGERLGLGVPRWIALSSAFAADTSGNFAING